MSHDALVHENVDDVAVVIHDVAAGDTVRAVNLDGQEVAVLKAVEAIPLGHKIALRAMPAEHHVIKYGRTIGRATSAIAKGAHVHIQNVKSIRWA
jgi:(2R)-sulfolactate sulfo-lyase subunit alpha